MYYCKLCICNKQIVFYLGVLIFFAGKNFTLITSSTNYQLGVNASLISLVYHFEIKNLLEKHCSKNNKIQKSVDQPALTQFLLRSDDIKANQSIVIASRFNRIFVNQDKLYPLYS